jgi:hypothetical protein
MNKRCGDGVLWSAFWSASRRGGSVSLPRLLGVFVTVTVVLSSSAMVTGAASAAAPGSQIRVSSKDSSPSYTWPEAAMDPSLTGRRPIPR